MKDKLAEWDQLLVEVNQRLAPIVEWCQLVAPLLIRLQRFGEAVAQITLAVRQESVKSRISEEVLGRAGWLPHYTTPFGYIAEFGDDIEAVQSGVLDYYQGNWQSVRLEIESRSSDYGIDSEAIAAFREALAAHEAGLYRCVCRVIFPEIERVLRNEIHGGMVGHLSSKKMMNELVGVKPLQVFMPRGLYELVVFRHFMKVIKPEDTSEGDKLIYGLFQSVESEEDRERLMQDPIPNRHATIHGLVVYSSPQNSLNAIFMADYILRVISSLRKARQREVEVS